MLTEFRDSLSKQNKERVVIGYDLGMDYVQISFCLLGNDVPETFSLVSGEEEYNIPILLCKKLSTNQWVCGREAQKAAQSGDGVLLSDLVQAAVNDKITQIDGQEYAATDLLALFVKKSFALLPLMTMPERIESVVITVRNADVKMIDILKKAGSTLKISPNRISYISYEESIFYYLLYQEEELNNHQVLVCDSKKDGLFTYRLERNRMCTPNVATVERCDYPDFDICGNRLQPGDKDRKFLRILSELCENRIVSGAFLIGDGFYEDWCKESLKFLCRNRRVFKGNNLYSKGACYAAKEQSECKKGDSVIFLGNDKLKSNIGLRVVRRGEEVYLGMLDAGCHWYEASKEADFILDETDTLPIVVTPISGRGVKIANFQLTGLPKRPRRACRVHMMIKMLTQTRVSVSVRDMGFGEVAMPSGMEWTEEFDI